MDASVVTIELPSELYADLQSLTEQVQAKDPVDMIARLVSQAQHPTGLVYATTPAFQRILDHAADLGVDDLSEQHDHYLYGTAKALMDATFVDTGYILALVNTTDKYHSQARATASTITPPFITTEAVLTEIGNALSGLRWRKLAVDTLNDLRTDPNIQVVTVDTAVFEQALNLFAARLDKEWGLTDCISFVVMQPHGVGQALTTDRHFEQAGFVNRLVKADG